MKIKGKFGDIDFEVVEGENGRIGVNCEDGGIKNYLLGAAETVFDPNTLSMERYSLRQGIYEAYLVLVDTKKQGFPIEFKKVPSELITKPKNDIGEVN